jgi:hypothetical protein
MQCVSSVLTRSSSKTFPGADGGWVSQQPSLLCGAPTRAGNYHQDQVPADPADETHPAKFSLRLLLQPGCERNWKPCIVVLGFGSTYVFSRSCITGAVHSYMSQFLQQVDPQLAERYPYSAQFEWTYIQSPTMTESTSVTQPVGQLRLLVNDPGDQSPEALHFVQHCHSRILAHIFQLSTASHNVQDFYELRIGRRELDSGCAHLFSVLRSASAGIGTVPILHLEYARRYSHIRWISRASLGHHWGS